MSRRRRPGFTRTGSTGAMNRSTWRRARRTALVVSCLGYFAALTVVGQVADGETVPDRPVSWLEARR